MKPRLGRRVYAIYENSILAYPVYALGKESFLFEPRETVLMNSLEWWYEDYGENWFTNLAEAKKALIEKEQDIYGGKWKVVKIADDYYEAEEIEEW